MTPEEARSAMNRKAVVHGSDYAEHVRGVIIEVDGDEATIRFSDGSGRSYLLEDIWEA